MSFLAPIFPVDIREGDCLDLLRAMPSGSVDACVTSPPYYFQKDYGVEGQIGLEPTPGAFVDRLVQVFREVRRVLRDEGTCWIVIGDTYNNRTRVRSSSHQPSLHGFRDEETWSEAAKAGRARLSTREWGLKEKDLMGLPWALATALRGDGWFLRMEVIWRKSFGKPDSTKDRLPLRHEQIFMLSKSSRYHFDRSAIPAWAQGTVWEVAPTGSSEHGATFPPALIEPCILAGVPVGGVVLDPFGGFGTTGLVSAKHGRRAILCELNPDYAALARERIARPITAVSVPTDRP